ncbi:unnamed protein product [Dracunculus medinensis]|uniref:Not3 domain-containing protein n=1 Tax=Dracunculus medinensis TaxID=318479 RepID=A0A0N4UA63_DRAME|nr:unnamed protein product [Dracunculus medinensis]
MAEKRKLLNEIDKCYKKIDEGVELFEETMSKMQEANSENQREKFQDDLKKEIKKLQRLRDQIKGWQNSSEIKDKEKLTHYRKVIEQRMEQFKDIERENKTKPHSKQGLSAEEKLDPREKEKAEAVEWLQCQIRCLEDEADKTESRIEMLATAEQTRKKGKRDDTKKGEKEKMKKLDDLRKHLDRIKFHISKVEICMRLVNNETLESSRVMDALKEPFDIYIEALDHESENDPEQCDPENAGVYDELDLQSYTPQLGGAIFGAGDAEEKTDSNNVDQKSVSSDSPTSLSAQLKETEENNLKQRHLSGGQISTTRSTPVTPLKLSNFSQVSVDSVNSPPASATPPPLPGIPYNIAAGLGTKSIKANFTPNSSVKQPLDIVRQPSGVISITTTTTTTSSITQPLGHSHSLNDENAAPNPVHVELPAVAATSQAMVVSPAIIPNPRSVTPESNMIKRFSISSAANAQQEVITLKPVIAQASSTADVNMLQPPNSLMNPYSVQPVMRPSSPNDTNTTNTTCLQTGLNISVSVPTTPTHPSSNDLDSNALRHTSRHDYQNQLPKTVMATIPAWLGASPLGKIALTGDMEKQLALLDNALTRLPAPMDSEKPRSYLPKMTCMTPSYYPQCAPPNADTLEYYLRLSPETLFFVFYYMEGSRAQLLAAKALKKLSWRFHTKYLMWFQRHEEPKQITDDYEQGTYIYFDFEKWAQRKKEQFTFEYRFLEDKDFE